MKFLFRKRQCSLDLLPVQQGFVVNCEVPTGECSLAFQRKEVTVTGLRRWEREMSSIQGNHRLLVSKDRIFIQMCSS